MTEPEQFRLFVAIALSDDVRDKLAAAQATLRRSIPNARVTWTQPAQFHLTLRFLGPVSSAQVAPLSESLKSACRNFAPLHLRAASIGFFPPHGTPRVIWAGIHDQTGQLTRLQTAAQTATAPFTSESPEKQFTSHATLGRIKSISPPDARALAKASAEMQSTPFGDWTAISVALMRSQLGPSGATHSVLADFPLLASS